MIRGMLPVGRECTSTRQVIGKRDWSVGRAETDLPEMSDLPEMRVHWQEQVRESKNALKSCPAGNERKDAYSILKRVSAKREYRRKESIGEKRVSAKREYRRKESASEPLAG
jgi:hypothetical protein